MLGSARKDLWWTSETGDLPRLFTCLIQNYSNKTATSLKFSALVAYGAHVVWLNFTKRRIRYMTDHGHTQWSFLPVRAARLLGVDTKQDSDESMSMYGFARSEVVPLEDAIE